VKQDIKEKGNFFHFQCEIFIVMKTKLSKCWFNWF